MSSCTISLPPNPYELLLLEVYGKMLFLRTPDMEEAQTFPGLMRRSSRINHCGICAKFNPPSTRPCLFMKNSCDVTRHWLSKEHLASIRRGLMRCSEAEACRCYNIPFLHMPEENEEVKSVAVAQAVLFDMRNTMRTLQKNGRLSPTIQCENNFFQSEPQLKLLERYILHVYNGRPELPPDPYYWYPVRYPGLVFEGSKFWCELCKRSASQFTAWDNPREFASEGSLSGARDHWQSSVHQKAMRVGMDAVSPDGVLWGMCRFQSIVKINVALGRAITRLQKPRVQKPTPSARDLLRKEAKAKAFQREKELLRRRAACQKLLEVLYPTPVDLLTPHFAEIMVYPGIRFHIEARDTFWCEICRKWSKRFTRWDNPRSYTGRGSLCDARAHWESKPHADAVKRGLQLVGVSSESLRESIHLINEALQETHAGMQADERGELLKRGRGSTPQETRVLYARMQLQRAKDEEEAGKVLHAAEQAKRDADKRVRALEEENKRLTDNIEAQSQCLLCKSSPRQVALTPCGHCVMCQSCYADFSSHNANQQLHNPAARRKCPMCRTAVTGSLRVFL